MISHRLIGSLLVALLTACTGNGNGSGTDAPLVPDAGPRVEASLLDGPPAPDGPAADASAPPDATTDATTADLTPTDSTSPDAALPLSRGLKWVRNNKMFISGLTVTMGAPPTNAVADYHNMFNASAVHLWQKGLPTAINGWMQYGGAGTRWVSWVRDDGTSHDVNKVIGGLTANPVGRIGYQVGDEPATVAALKTIEAGVNAVRKADPNALVYVNFSCHANDILQQLSYYKQMDADVVSYDYYSQKNKTYREMNMFRLAGLQQGRPYWRYMNSYFTVPPGKKSLTESDLRWDAFSGLVFGYTGHTWFLYQVYGDGLFPAFFNAAKSFGATKTPLYLVAAKINKEMANLGRAITQLTSTDVRYTPSIGLLQPLGTQSWKAGAGKDPYLAGLIAAPGQPLLDSLAGFFRDDAGEIYVMVQNVRHLNGDWPIDSDKDGTLRLTFDFSTAPASLDKTKLLSLDKVTGKVVSLPLTALGGGKMQYDAKLAAGDALLFKYASGKPFVLGP
jgi:hypothetical protein